MRDGRVSPTLSWVIVFGCIWGFLEAVTFAGMQNRYWGVLFPYHLCPCFLMSAVFGSLVMGAFLAIHKNPAMLAGIGLAATVSGWLSVPFMPDVVRADYFGNWIPSATAIVVGSLSLALVASLLREELEKGSVARMGIGVLSGLIASSVFIVVTEYGVDEGICAVLGYARPLPDFLGVGGLVWMALQGALLPLGYQVGECCKNPASVPARNALSLSYPRLAAVAGVFVGCSVVAFVVGA